MVNLQTSPTVLASQIGNKNMYMNVRLTLVYPKVSERVNVHFLISTRGLRHCMDIFNRSHQALFSFSLSYQFEENTVLVSQYFANTMVWFQLYRTSYSNTPILIEEVIISLDLHFLW